jgi:ribosomal protein S24E
MDFINDVRNELLKRREIQFKINSESNPGFESMKKNIVEGLKVADENVIVKNVKNNFGANDFLVEALIYDSVEHRQMFEPKKKEKKKAGGN